MTSYGNISRRIVAATRRLQELLKVLLNIPLYPLRVVTS